MVREVALKGIGGLGLGCEWSCRAFCCNWAVLHGRCRCSREKGSEKIYRFTYACGVVHVRTGSNAAYHTLTKGENIGTSLYS